MIAFSLLLAAFATQEPKADLVLTDAKVLTMNPASPEASALAISGNRIVYVGDEEGAKAWIGKQTQVWDVEKKLVLPGFVEGHGHLLGVGLSLLDLDLVGTRSVEGIADKLREKAAAAGEGEWILGRGWDQNDWKEKNFPTHRDLDAVAPDRPVALTRIDGHALWANRKALEAAGIGRDTPDPPGGRILRDVEGNPTGILVDRAMDLLRRKIPPRSREEREKAIRLAIEHGLRRGVTSFHDAGADAETISIYRKLLAEGALGLRLYVMLAGSNAALIEEHFRKGPEIGLGGKLTIRAIKLVADGALGSRGAALLEDYADEPGNRGLLMLSEEEIYRIAKKALASGFQVCTHAIGDRANRVVLDAYERAFREFPDKKDHRFRVEHAQILDEKEIPRFAKLGVIASMQAAHCTSDGPWVYARIGEARAKEGAYVWRKLLDSGARVMNGSDAPVESVDPVLGIHAATTRNGWHPEQSMCWNEAIRSFTLDSTFGAFQEQLLGSLEAGKLADLVVVGAKDLEEIGKSRVDAVILDGRPVFENAGLLR